VVAGFGRFYLSPGGLASRLPSFPSSSMDEQEEDGGSGGIRGKDKDVDDDGGESSFSRRKAGDC
jgi:hypothetical protein